MVEVQDVANWFLSHAPMTHKKLQKLCYYAQAWYCALYDKGPLFRNEIQAWVHGPVIASLYPAYADYRWNEIPKVSFDESKFSDDVLDVLRSVYHTYSQFSGDQLESLTHAEDPWQIARGDLKPWETCTAEITPQSMRDYYGRLYAESQSD